MKSLKFEIFDANKSQILVQDIHSINPYRTELFYDGYLINFELTDIKDKRGVVIDLSGSRDGKPIYLDKLELRKK